MKKKSPYKLLLPIIIGMLLCGCGNLGGSTVWKGDIDTYKKLEKFHSREYNQVNGSIYVPNMDKEHLKLLENLTSVSEDVTIAVSNLTSLEGLENLVSINGQLVIGTNEHLVTLEGLHNLKEVGGINISHNTSLISLDGLRNLSTINHIPIPQISTSIPNPKRGDAIITENSVLESVDGLENLVFIDGNLEITRNNALEAINGINSLVKINNGLLSIEYNNNLKQINGLQNVSRIDNGGVVIDGNQRLLSINGLNSISTLNYILDIRFNDSLQTVKGFNSLTKITALWITNNNALSNLDGLSSITIAKDDILISKNPKLNNFCFLNDSLVSNFSYTQQYNAYDNEYNPTINDLKNDKCKPTE